MIHSYLQVVNGKLQVSLIYNAYVNCKMMGLVLRILQNFV